MIGEALVQRGGLRSHLPAATEHGGARLERAAVGLRLGVGHRRLSLGGRLVHEGDGETDCLGRRLHLDLGLLDVRRVHRADVKPRDAQQQQPQPLLLRRRPRRRYQLRLRAVRRVGRVEQRLVRRRRGGGEARLRAARAHQRRVELGGGQQAGALPQHGREECGTCRVEVLGGRHGGARQQQLKRTRAAREIEGSPGRFHLDRAGQPLLELGRLDRRVEQVGAALEQPRQEDHAPLPRRVTRLEAAHQRVDHPLAAPVDLVEQRVLLPQLELRRPPHRLPSGDQLRQASLLRRGAAAPRRGVKAGQPEACLGAVVRHQLEHVLPTAGAWLEQHDLQGLWVGPGASGRTLTVEEGVARHGEVGRALRRRLLGSGLESGLGLEPGLGLGLRLG